MDKPQHSILDKFILSVLALMIMVSCIIPANVKAAADTEDDGKKQKEPPPDAPMQYAGGKTLSGNHTYSDLYASFIFSRSGETASQEKTTTDALLKYPTDPNDTSDPTADTSAYGQLGTPFDRDTPDKKQGKQAATLINTLYDYEYLVPDSNSEKGALGPFKAIYDVIADKGRKGNGTITAKALDSSSIGAQMFDFFTAAIDKFAEIVGQLDIAKIATGQVGDNDGYLMKWIDDSLDSFGLSEQNIKVIKGLFVVIILGSAILSMIVAFGSRNVKYKSGSSLKRWGLRLFVSIMTLTVAIVLTQTLDKLTDFSSESTTKSAAKFNENYVMDTLLVAATTNLNIGKMNPSQDIAAHDDGSKDENFKPTPSGLTRVMKDANQRAQYSGIGQQDITAKDLLNQVANQKPASVDDYLSMLEQGSKSDNITAASTTPIYDDISAGYEAGDAFSKDDRAKIDNAYTDQDLSRNPIFMTDNPDATASFKKVMEEYKDKDNGSSKNKRIYYIPPEKKATKEGKKKVEKVRKTNVNSMREEVSGKIGRKLSYKNVSHSPIPQAGSQTYKMSNVSPADTSTYIYGAVAPGKIAKQQREPTNFYNGPHSAQRADPVTGKKPKDKKLKNSMNINGLRIGLMNRYGGVASMQGVQMKSMSTQSTTFLLQTEHPESGALHYKGFNAVASENGEAKQTGKNGAGFLRYSIPNTGKTDLMTKIGSINVIWIVAGIISTMSFIYLLICPIFGSVYKQAVGFCSGFFMGNFAGTGKYVLYRVAIALSFVFANLAIYSGVRLASVIVNQFDMIGQIFSMKNFLPGSFSASATMILGLIIGVALMWPVAKVSLGRKGKMRTLSVLGTFIAFSYIIADILAAKLDDLYDKVYGGSTGSNLVGNIKNRTQRIKQGQLAKNAGKKVGKGALQIGAGVMSGGTSTAATAAAGASKAALARGATKKLGGALGKNIAMGKKAQGLSTQYGLSRGLLRDGKNNNIKGMIADQMKPNFMKGSDQNGSQSPDMQNGQVDGQEFDSQGNPIGIAGAAGIPSKGNASDGRQTGQTANGSKSLSERDENGNQRKEDNMPENSRGMSNDEIRNTIGTDGEIKSQQVERFDEYGNRIQPEYDENGRYIDDGKQHYDKDGNAISKDDIQTERLSDNAEVKSANNDNTEISDNGTAGKPQANIAAGINRDGQNENESSIVQADGNNSNEPQEVRMADDQTIQTENDSKSQDNNVEGNQSPQEIKYDQNGQPQDVNINDDRSSNDNQQQVPEVKNDNSQPQEIKFDQNGQPQDVNINDDRSTNSQPQDVNINDDRSTNSQPQDVNINDDRSTNSQPQDVHISNDSSQPQQVQNISNNEPQQVKMETSDGQRVQFDSGNLAKLVGNQTLSTDTAKALQDIGKSNISPEIARELNNNSQFNKAMDFRDQMNHKIELDEKSLDNVKSKMQQVEIQSKANGINPSDNSNYTALKDQFNKLTDTISQSQSNVLAADDRMRKAVKSAAASTRTERIINKSKETKEFVKETKQNVNNWYNSDSGSSNIAKGLTDIVRGNDSGGSSNSDINNAGSSRLSNGSQSSNLRNGGNGDRKHQEIINELRKMRRENRDKK